MLLHEKADQDREGLEKNNSDPALNMPKFKMPAAEYPADKAYQLIADELMLDGNSRQNLATFCQTWFEPEVRKLMDLTIDKNMIDKDEYPETAEMEARCVHILADLWNSPSAAHTLGTSTTGSSEACMLGGLALLRQWRNRRKAQGKPIDKPNLVTGPVQVCWHKFACYWDIELREVPMENDRIMMNGAEAVKRCDENTIGVVPTFGLTFTGQYEDVKEITEALDKLQKETGLDIPVHVDAASGGFLAPFTNPEIIWDFRLPRVKSINASGHKYGLSPLGVGWVIWRDKQDLPEELIFRVNYLGGDMPTFALNFSRPGGQIVSQYFNFVRLGQEGYRKVQQECYDTAQFIAKEIEAMGLFEVIHGGSSAEGLPCVSWKLKDNISHKFSLFDLEDRLRMRGWQVPAYSLPAHCEDTVIQRILVRRGFTRDLGRLFIENYREVIQYFERNPQSVINRTSRN